MIVDNDAAVVRRAVAANEPPGVPWMKADACEVSRLAEAGVDKADVVAAVTGDDEDNLVVSLLAKQEFGVPRVVARVNNPKNEWMFNESWGVDVAVSTPHLLTALVEEAVSVGTLVRILSFEGGKARLAEVTLAESSPAADKEIVELELPRDSTVVAVLRRDRLVVPRGDTVLRTGDEVLVLVTDESEGEVRAILTGALGEPALGEQRVGGVDDHETPALRVRDALDQHAPAGIQPADRAAPREDHDDLAGAVGEHRFDRRRSRAGDDPQPLHLASDAHGCARRHRADLGEPEPRVAIVQTYRVELLDRRGEAALQVLEAHGGQPGTIARAGTLATWPPES